MGTRYIVAFRLDSGVGSVIATNRIYGSRSFDDAPFPTVVGGITQGPVSEGLVGADSAGWEAGDDPAVRGRWQRVNGDAALPYRIVAPEGAGDYRLWYGTAVTYDSRRRVRIADGPGGAVLSDVSYAGGTGYPSNDDLDTDAPSGPAWQQWVDHAGVVRAMNAAVFAAISAPIEVTVASGVLEILNGGHASGAFNSSLSFLAFEKIEVGPTVTAVSPTSGRATGTQIDITVDDSTGATAADVGGDPLTGFTIVNGTTVRGMTDGATTGAVTVTNGDGTGTGPTFTVVPVANQIRFQGGGTAPWSPAEGPTVGVPYTFTVEAWSTVANARDTLITGDVTIGIDFEVGGEVDIVSGDTTRSWSAGLATFTNVIFAERDDDTPINTSSTYITLFDETIWY